MAVNEVPLVPEGAISRGSLELVLRQGPPTFLSQVPVEEVFEGRKFVGWRLQELPRAWSGIELQPGDVVTAVNAMPLETPNDFWAAWTSLSVASELKVAYLRDGEALEMSLPIYGQPSADLSKEMNRHAPGRPAQTESPVQAGGEKTKVPPKRTITIESKERPLSDTNTDWSDHPW